MSVTPATWLTCCAWIVWRKRGSPHRRFGSCGRWSGSGPSCPTWRWLLERFPELEATLAHLDRVDNQIALLTIGTGTEDRGLGPNE